MRKLCLSALCLLFFAVSTAGSVTDSVPAHQSVGLVLSGGGAKGIAHIGVIQALEDNDIPIDYVTGTSMGAIVGGLYAAGYTPAEMMDMIQSRGFQYWSSGRIDPNYTYRFEKNEKTPAFVTLNLGKNDSSKVSSVLPTSLINPLPMNFAFMELFSAYTAQCGGDFNRLFVPFRSVCSDVYNKRKIVCRGGSLGDAIRASMSFPLVFRPIELDGVLVYDGGIYDNFPFDVMREDFAPSIFIGVDVSGPNSKPKANDLYDQLEDMIMQKSQYEFPADEGIRIHIDLHEFGLLDWDKAREIYNIGYRRGMAMIDSIKSRVTTRTPRELRELRRGVFKSATPYVRFDSVSVSGGSPSQNRYIDYLFTHSSRRDTFGISAARDAYYRAITPGQLENLMPRAVYNDSTGLFALGLKADVKDKYNIGVGGYLTSATTSMLFLSAGYNTISYNSLSGNLKGWAGQSYLAATADAKVHFMTRRPSYLKIMADVSRQKFHESEKLFFEKDNPTFVTRSEVFGRLAYCMETGRHSVAEAGVGYGHLTDRFYQSALLSTDPDLARDRLVSNLGQVYLSWERSTLDDAFFPTSGSEYRVAVGGYHGTVRNDRAVDGAGDSDTHPSWLRTKVKTRNYFNLCRHFSLGVELEAVASTRKLLSTYDASIVSADAFHPTASSYNAFNIGFRANSYGALGVVPVWKMNSTLQLRGSGYLFIPYRKILPDKDGFAPCYGRRFRDPQFLGELAAVATFPFASLSVYGNYMTYPARNWNCGISFGLFILAPKFIR